MIRGNFAVAAIWLLACVILQVDAYAQKGTPQKIDSLKRRLAVVTVDTDRVKIMIKLSKYTDCKDSVQKVLLAKQAIALSEKAKWLKGLYRSYYQLGEVYHDCAHNYPNAIGAYTEAMGISGKIKDTALQVEAISALALIYQNTGHYAQALDYLNSVMKLTTKNYSKIGLWGNIGEVYRNMGNYTMALECYEKSLRLVNEDIIADKSAAAKYVLTQAGLMSTIANVYESMGDHDKAVNNYEKMLAIGEQVQNRFVTGLANQGMGHVYQVKKQSDTAIVYYTKALEDMRAVPYGKANEVEILNQLADIYLEKGNVKDATAHTMASIKIATELNDKNNLGVSYAELGKIYTHTKDFARATGYLQQAIAIAKEIGAKVNEQSAWEVLSECYTAMHQSDKAFAAYKNYIALRDSVYNADKARELTRMDMQGEFDRAKAADSVKQADEGKIMMLKMQRQKTLTYSGYAGVVVLLLLAFFIFRNYNNKKKALGIISKAHEELKNEQAVSETLLLNILPEEVATELKADGKVQARLFDNVTVLFTDFVEFTTMSERLTPQELVAELHTCFSAFDEIVGRHNVEKIKTVGDAYLAVAGLPHAQPNHAANAIKAAIEIRDYMLERKSRLGDDTFGIRVGINSGNVVAGIVGARKYAYDIWGDTVNTAARMEQNSTTGKINISQSTYKLVKDQFACTYRGEIAAKNKGMQSMYFVELG